MPPKDPGRLRLSAASDVALTEDAGQVIYEWSFQKRPGDQSMLVAIEVVAGEVALRFNAEVADRFALTASGEEEVEIANLPTGENTARIRANATPSTLGLVEAHIRGP